MQRFFLRGVSLAVLAVAFGGTACTSSSTGDDNTTSSSSSGGGGSSNAASGGGSTSRPASSAGGSSGVIASSSAPGSSAVNSSSRPASSAGGSSSGVVVSSSAGGGSSGVVGSSSVGGGSSGVVGSSSVGGGSSGVVVSSSAGGGSSGVVVSSSAGGGSSGVVGSSSGGGGSSSGGLPPEANCTNLLDDDLDNFVDCADTDCAGNPACVPGAGATGTACTANTDCVATGNDPTCLTEAEGGYPAGYCSEGCVGGPTFLTGTGCSGTSICGGQDGQPGICFAQCNPAGNDCRPGYTCQTYGTSPNDVSLCVANCTGNADCGVTNFCDTDPLSNTAGLCLFCGNGVVDTARGEECEGTTAPVGQKCDACQLSPDTWTCRAAWYDTGLAGDCDCGCGIVDPDCADATLGSCNYCEFGCSTQTCAANTEIDPANNAVCVMPVCGNNTLEGNEVCDGTAVPPGYTCLMDCTGVVVPAAWTCQASWYSDSDCDCGCGALDPRCADATLASCTYCQFGCSTEVCAGNTQIDPVNNAVCLPTVCGNNVIEGAEVCDGTAVPAGYTCLADCSGVVVPAAWLCDPAYYSDGDCDCGCGAFDPTCADATLASCTYCDDLGSCSSQTCGANTQINPANNAVCL